MNELNSSLSGARACLRDFTDVCCVCTSCGSIAVYSTLLEGVLNSKDTGYYLFIQILKHVPTFRSIFDALSFPL